MFIHITWRQAGGPEARNLSGVVWIHDIVIETDHLHVECLLETTVKAGVTDHSDPHQSLVSNVTVMRGLRNSWERISSVKIKQGKVKFIYYYFDEKIVKSIIMENNNL